MVLFGYGCFLLFSPHIGFGYKRGGVPLIRDNQI